MNLKVLTNPKLFFEEWKDNKKLFSLLGFVSMFMIIFLFWFLPNVPELKDQALIYSLFLIIGIMVGSLDYVLERNNIFGFVFAGKSLKNLAIALLIGGIIGVLLQLGNFAIIKTPLSAIQITGGLASFIFVVLIAPYSEEKFFRMAVYPTSYTILKTNFGWAIAGISAVLITCGSFAFFHYAVFNANWIAMLSAFVFSLIAIFGNRIFESVGFSLGMHYINNFIAWLAMMSVI